MSPGHILLWTACTLIAGTIAFVIWQIRRRNLQYWLGGYLLEFRRRRSTRERNRPLHVLLCIADHFEPSWGNATAAQADQRMAAWMSKYPQSSGQFRDSDGRPPRHTFFYPIDQYEPRHVDELAILCRQGFGEVEIHLHHDHDTAENLTRTLGRFSELFSQRHGLLGRAKDGRPVYGFVHGNWALDNSRPDHRWCGVDNEIDVLRRTGCYADFTLPSAPDATQTRKINSIYYAVGKPGACKSHDLGIDVGTAPPSADGLMLIQGPLLLTWSKGRLVPAIENGCLQRSQPPTMARLDRWIKANVHVASRPDWVFVKLHTHGATEANQQVVLGEAMVEFHRSLARRAAADERFCFHYVTAREMYNLAKAAEAGWEGPVDSARDFLIAPPPIPPLSSQP